MNNPRIEIRNDASRDADMVWRFLHHPRSTHFARYITNIHPGLVAIHDDEKAVRQWVADWHDQHAKELQDIQLTQENIINEKGAAALNLLGSLMNYQWPPNIIYTAFFSLLPFSPFEGNNFFYSVLRDISGKTNPGGSVLSVGIHEISHLIFFLYIKNITQNTGWSLQQDAVHYLKESLTTVLMNTPEFMELLGTQRHKGNPELWDLYINDSHKPIAIVQWLENQYAKSLDEKVAFSDWLTRIVILFHSAESELSAHISLWRAHAPNIDQEIHDQYSRPICLTN